jgi:D-sedoheptulose 7-phosphate isomerase
MTSPDSYLKKLLNNYPALAVCKSDIEKSYEQLVNTYNRGGKLLICGNGGSAADADHIVGELMKGFQSPRKLPEAFQKKLISTDSETGAEIYKKLQGSLPAIDLSSQSGIITATLNDIHGKYIFAQQIIGYGKEEDSLLAISTSGNSEDILTAITVAKAKGMKTIGLSGESGGKMAEKCDIIIKAPSKETARIQEYHLPIYHTLCLMLEAKFFA